MRFAERSPRRPWGMTVTELMVTLFIAVILAMLSVPSVSGALLSARLSTQASDLFGALQRARSEAITRATPVTVCRSTNGLTCSMAANWEAGWIVFVDGNGNGTVDASDTLVRVTPALADNYTLRASSTFSTSITFKSDGSAQGSGWFILCQKNLISAARAVNINLVGRVANASDANANGIPEDDSGADYTTCTPP